MHCVVKLRNIIKNGFTSTITFAFNTSFTYCFILCRKKLLKTQDVMVPS